MSDYTKINIKDLDNSSQSDKNEMRFARDAIKSNELGVSLISYGANFKTSFAHSHKEQEEVYVVVRGSGKMLLDDTIEVLNQWDVVRVAPSVIRSFQAGPDGLEIVAVGGQKPDGGDGEKHEVTWPE